MPARGAGVQGRQVQRQLHAELDAVGDELTGWLTLSNPAGRYKCTGTINGSGIQFGAVSVGANYTGSVSSNGKSMSGNWKSPVDSGSWSATKP